jgi:hypothetical protein
MAMSSVFINYLIKALFSKKKTATIKTDSAVSTGRQGKLYVI